MLVCTYVQTKQYRGYKALRTGKQIKAARALLGFSQVDLAERAGVHANSVKYWEAREAVPDDGGAAMIREALKRAGVVFVPGGATLEAVAA